MTDNPLPAFTPEEWSRIVDPGSDSPQANARTIALANAALPDSDLRKLTHERLDSLSGDVTLIEALRSYLPPRE